jgi:alpha-amylase/alpha-mannosidase (GH57 family)
LERYICIHGHFYQPPRENPWLEAIELQDSAYPYHDWNERVTEECYAPNSASRIVDDQNRILRIVNNYSKISFNFGPTLLQWMESSAPDVYAAILEADRESRKNFSGHGSALAQGFNHMILPLANMRDKRTQVIWGLRDFEHRFGRPAEGMWLPETAVDLETLNIMAAEGLRFTILSPYQASRMRRMPGGWIDASGGRIDPSTPYRVNLRAGRHIDIFFYDGPISSALAFENLLLKGEYLADRMAGAFSAQRDWPQLIHIATDGETYGHHRRQGDMALAYALHHIEKQKLARLTNYGEFLEKHPPIHEAEILDNSAWSCAHGVERWRSDCGCSTGMNPGWNQRWRAPLRGALDWLRDTLAPCYAEKASPLLREPWAARDEYISVMLDRSEANVEAFFSRHAAKTFTAEEKVTALELLELQRHAMLMYTSCGWFFDDLSGIETVQVIQYAARALQLAGKLFGGGLEPKFLDYLEQAKSNLAASGDGRQIYEKLVRPSMVDLSKVGAHYAVSSLFENYGDSTRVFCYEVARERSIALQAGEAKFVLGQARITSAITRESQAVAFGVLHLGEHNISGGIRPADGAKAFSALEREVRETFRAGDLPEILRLVYENFGAGAYSLKLLFRDEQRRILRIILETSLARAEASYRYIYGTDAPLMYFVKSLKIPLPNRFRMAADFVLNTDLRREFESRALDLPRIQTLLEEADRLGIVLDERTLEFALRRTIERIARSLAEKPEEVSRLQELSGAVTLARSLPFPANLWTPQNIYHDLLRRFYPEMKTKADAGDAAAQVWTGMFRAAGERLSIRVE